MSLLYKIASFILFLFFASCGFQDEISKNAEKIDDNSNIEQIAYTKNNFKNIGTELAKIANDNFFRMVLYREVEKKFDGDYNVLLSDLISELKQRSKNGRMSSVTTLSLNQIEPSLLFFKNIDGRNYYPQIYIPFFETKREMNIDSNSARRSGNSEPMFVFFAGDESQDIYPGYQMNQNGKFEETGILIDENYAENNEVWVLSINERVNDNGVVDVIWRTDDLSSARITSYGDAIIPTMKIKSHKESWAGGQSEVHVLRYVDNSSFTDRTGKQIALQGRGSNEGDQIVKASRKDVKNKRELAVGFTLVPAWNIMTTDVVYYVIFEYDTWPTGVRDARWDKTAGTLILGYRSADGWYDKKEFSRWDAPYYQVNNSEIEFYVQYP